MSSWRGCIFSNPELPVIVVTSEHVTGDEPSFFGALRVLRKPVAIEELLSAIAEASSQRLAKAPPRPLASGTPPLRSTAHR